MNLSIILLVSTYFLTVWSTPLSKECVDTNKTCLLHETCCSFKGEGSTGCCPLNNAVCCKDQTHCCPQGYECSDEDLLCEREPGYLTRKIPIPRTFPLRKLEKFDNDKNIQGEVCEDGISVCADGDTCCKLESGMWGCCPIQNARCCQDGKHCCPRAYECNDDDLSYCVLPDSQLNLSPTILASLNYNAVSTGNYMVDSHLNKKIVKGEVCEDGISVCADGDTCCKLESGMWGCCPIQNARCCKDGKHCCPRTYECNDDDLSYCVLPDSQLNLNSTSWVKAGVKYEAKNIADIMEENNLHATTCADNSTCPDNYSCCQLDAQGDFGCCEGSNSVCCGDLEHWCPEGYACDLGRGECKQASINVDGQTIAL